MDDGLDGSSTHTTTSADDGTDSTPGTDGTTTTGSEECPATHLRIFVSSAQVDGTITSNCGTVAAVDRADCLCQTLADAAFSDASTFQAWLSTEEDPVRDRLAPKGSNDLPFCLVDGTVVVHDWAELTNPDAPLRNGIALDELGNSFNGFVWTGSDAAGEATAATCNGWTGSGEFPTGERGEAGQTSSAWTHGATSGCGNSLRLYCLER